MATLPWLRACVKLRLALPGAASYGSRLQLAPPPSHATPPRRLACACPPPIAICRASCALCGHPVTGAGRALAPGRCGSADLASQRLAAGPAVGRSHTRSRPLALCVQYPMISAQVLHRDSCGHDSQQSTDYQDRSRHVATERDLTTGLWSHSTVGSVTRLGRDDMQHASTRCAYAGISSIRPPR